MAFKSVKSCSSAVSSRESANGGDHAVTLRVSSGSRLHFGLFSTGIVDGTAFGGVGMMIDEPGTIVSACAADCFEVCGSESTLVNKLAERIAKQVDRPLPKLQLNVEAAAPRHAGLGSGTQLGMCIARVLFAAWEIDASNDFLAQAAGRGKRSGIGVHGFANGGLIVDAGKTDAEELAPVIERVEVPVDWRVLLIWPSELPAQLDVASNKADSFLAGANGDQESAAFAQLSCASPQLAESLRREAIEMLIPALTSRDFTEFSASVARFNRLAGECFAPVQGGAYASPVIERTIQSLHQLGVRGAGQSSWGPVVYAFCETDGQAQHLRALLRSGDNAAGLKVARVIQTRPRNTGFQLDRR